MKRQRDTKSYKKAKRNSGVRKDRVAYKSLTRLHPDFKVNDTFNNLQVDVTPSFISVLSGMTTGSAARGQYVGRTIAPVGLDLRFEIIGSQTSTFLGADLYNNLRLMVFQWMDDATVTGAGTFQSIADGLGAGFATTSPITFKNYNNIEVLMDENFQTFINAFESTPGGYAVSNLQCGRRYIKAKKMREVEFDGTGGDTTTKGGLFYVVVSDSVAVPNPTINIVSRLTFLDV